MYRYWKGGGVGGVCVWGRFAISWERIETEHHMTIMSFAAPGCNVFITINKVIIIFLYML